ncbi:hypothetical protein ACWCP8_40945 [Streptomyces sp. NPDC002206]
MMTETLDEPHLPTSEGTFTFPIKIRTLFSSSADQVGEELNRASRVMTPAAIA